MLDVSRPSRHGAFRRLLARPLKSNRGNVAIIFGLTLPIVIGGAGLGVETSYWYLRDVQLQAAADAAAYAGAIQKRSGSTNATVTTVATGLATSNGFDSSSGTIAVNVPPTSGPNQAALAVEVILTQSVPRFFTKVFSNSVVTAYARAVATYSAAGNACILALDPTAPKSVLFSGNTGVNVKGCDVMSNSTAIDAIKTQGSSVTKAGCFITTGGVDITGGSVTLDCPKSVTHAPAIADPFAGVAAPTASGGCMTDSGATRSPGKYCSGMDLKNTVELAAGTYYVTGGDFKVNANAIVTSAAGGVTIYLSGTARVSMNGNSQTTLTAPTTGTYAGILFFGDRTNTAATANSYNGNTSSKLTGYLYHASQPVQYLGNFSGVNGCTRVVAKTIEWSGNTTVDDTQNCSSLGLPSIALPQLISLKE
jgi:Flp pilus assembly protein TadG